MILLAMMVTAAPAQSLPAEVQRYIDRRAGCDHWRGEDSPDPGRRRQIDAALRKDCTGSDRELDRLRHKYRGVRHVAAALEEYDKVESE
jgi:hypothetical protein